LEEAWDLARDWSLHQDSSLHHGALEDIGVEVSTGSGAWRRLRPPAAAPRPEA